MTDLERVELALRRTLDEMPQRINDVYAFMERLADQLQYLNEHETDHQVSEDLEGRR